MLNNINMEFIQALNPLYAIPILVVIFCAFIVYALGFKSPVQPPSFEGIEEEKKPKKRRGKENQKNNKLQQNGKVNGNTVTKANIVKKETSENKKKDSEKHPLPEKPNTVEKTSAAEKKASKKSRAQNEKKVLQEKKESFSYEEQNDDGWVQLISKKGRKNRKKDDAAASETNAPSVTKVTEAAKSDDNSPIEESPKKHTGSSKDKKQSAPIDLQEKFAKDVKVASVEKPKMQNVVVEVSKPDKAEKQPKKETAAKEIKALEESNKSKKKKKKNADVIPQVNEPAGNISSTISDSSAKQVISENVAPTKVTPNITNVAELPPPSSNTVEANKSSDSKSSNVAFDELAGLYPETKEQKKKKKVRRDH